MVTKTGGILDTGDNTLLTLCVYNQSTVRHHASLMGWLSPVLPILQEHRYCLVQFYGDVGYTSIDYDGAVCGGKKHTLYLQYSFRKTLGNNEN